MKNRDEPRFQLPKNHMRNIQIEKVLGGRRGEEPNTKLREG